MSHIVQLLRTSDEGRSLGQLPERGGSHVPSTTQGLGFRVGLLEGIPGWFRV